MNMEFRTLQQTPLEELSVVFNQAFQNYFVEIALTPEQLAGKFAADGVRLDLSVGAFYREKLVGFIFHGTNEQAENRVAYNGGTGVIPEYRGQQLTIKMYEFILLILKQEEVKKIRLEAITENIRAIKSYTDLGFSIIRKVDCFRGNFKTKETSHEIILQQQIDEETAQQLWEVTPTWQNSFLSVRRQAKAVQCLIVKKENQVAGYLLLHTKNGRVMQFAVHPQWRNNGIASALFQKAAQLKETLAIINLDSKSEITTSFLKKHGFNYTLSQYEMELELL